VLRVSAYILINTEIGKVDEALTGLKEIEEVKSAYSITGPYDIIAFVESEDLVSLGSMVVQKVQKVEGISKTLTCLIVK